MLDIQLDMKSIESALSIAPNQVRFAATQAINKTAWDVRDGIKKDMPNIFDNPTPYTINSLRVYQAKQSNLSAEINFKGKASDHYLRPEVFGGPRPMKVFEKLLGGYYVPSNNAPKDRYGNITGGQIVRMLSMLGRNRAGQNQSPAKRKMRMLKGVKQFFFTEKGHIAERMSKDRMKIWFWKSKRAPVYKSLLKYNDIAAKIIESRLSGNVKKAISMAFKRGGF